MAGNHSLRLCSHYRLQNIIPQFCYNQFISSTYHSGVNTTPVNVITTYYHLGVIQPIPLSSQYICYHSQSQVPSVGRGGQQLPLNINYNISGYQRAVIRHSQTISQGASGTTIVQEQVGPTHIEYIILTTYMKLEVTGNPSKRIKKEGKMVKF